jgi:phosphoglycerol transferase
MTAILCALAASTGVYYAFFGMLLIVFAGIVASLNSRSKTHVVSALLIAGFIGLVTFLNVLPNYMSPLMHQKTGGSQRALGESEIYGLKIVQLILPRSEHNLEFLAKIKRLYNASTPPSLFSENDWSALGFIAALGFLCSLLIVFIGRFNAQDIYKKISVLNLFAVLLSTIGGFSFFISYFITAQIRAYNRISVFIAFLSLLFVARALSDFQDKYVKTRWYKVFFISGLYVLLLVALYDQVPARWVTYKYQDIIKNDKAYFSTVQSKLGKDAVVFQLPYMPFPESVPINKLADYEHFRGYLNTDGVKWSYGAFKGTDADAIIKYISKQTGSALVEDLVATGYTGLYIDRFGYADSAAALEKQVRAIIRTEPFVSHDDRFVVYDLSPYKAELVKKNPTALGERFEQIKESALGVYLPGEWITQDDDKRLVSGWSSNEGTHRWSEGPEAKVDFKLKAIDPKRAMMLVVEPKMVLGRQHVEILPDSTTKCNTLTESFRRS